jgi:D-threo-aldose 1-dehydrogenase
MSNMNQRPVGKTGLQVSLLGLGAAPLAGLYRNVPESQAKDTIRTALDTGLTLIDTAPRYGNGLSEQRLGTALADVPPGQYTIATKVGWLVRPGERAVPDFSRDGVLRSLEASLERLQLDHVDILHIHDPDRYYQAAIEEAYPALDSLRRQGVIKAVSVGINQWEMLEDFVRDGDFDCFMLAGRYTLLEQKALPLLDLCAERDIGILLAGVYNSGILATGPIEGAKYNYRDAPPAIMEKARRLDDLCKRYDVPLRAVALQFPLGHPAISSLVIGFSSPDRVSSNLGYLETQIPDALWAELRESGLISPECPLDR